MTMTVATVMLSASGALVVVGTWTLRRNWWPRRVGDAPHCRRCGYNVAAIASERCPECGSARTAGNTVFGRRERRPGLALVSIGMLLFGLALGGLYAEQRWIRHINWYQHRPFAWLMDDLDRSPDSRTVALSWGELLRREEAGLLSESQYQVMIERALVEQGVGARTRVTGFWMTFLERVAFAGRLNDAQRLRYVTTATRGSLTIPTGGEDAPLGFRIAGVGRGGDISWLQHWRLWLSVDGNSVIAGTVGDTGWGLSGPNYEGTLPPLLPGKHVVRATIDISVGSDEVHLFGDEEHQPPTQTLTVDVEIPGPAANNEPPPLPSPGVPGEGIRGLTRTTSPP